MTKIFEEIIKRKCRVIGDFYGWINAIREAEYRRRCGQNVPFEKNTGMPRLGDIPVCLPKAKKLSVGVNADLLFVLGLVLKFDVSVDQSEKGIIGSHADIVAGVDRSSSLSDDDIACKNIFAVRFLHAEALGFTVASVLCRADTSFMSKKL